METNSFFQSFLLLLLLCNRIQTTFIITSRSQCCSLLNATRPSEHAEHTTAQDTQWCGNIAHAYQGEACHGDGIARRREWARSLQRSMQREDRRENQADGRCRHSWYRPLVDAIVPQATPQRQNAKNHHDAGCKESEPAKERTNVHVCSCRLSDDRTKKWTEIKHRTRHRLRQSKRREELRVTDPVIPVTDDGLKHGQDDGTTAIDE
mmetsp:Transcript_10913/g.24666  ORF Transcript_10913/g.24666 Transcript_10913/m.24666 type:complete len:207 (+) Transcript_10913:1745-2365(+)